MNKEWSLLDDGRETGGLKRGHFAEYFAEMSFMLHGFEVYKSVVDDRGIDYIVKNPNRVYFEIQVKSITDYNNIPISRDKFDVTNDHLYLVGMQFIDNQNPLMYIVPADRFIESDTIFYDSGESIKQPQYGLRINKKKRGSLDDYEFEKYIARVKERTE